MRVKILLPPWGCSAARSKTIGCDRLRCMMINTHVTRGMECRVEPVCAGTMWFFEVVSSCSMVEGLAPSLS